MKKLISIVLCIVSILSLSACGASEEVEYEKIQLTKDNYSDYININVYVDDYSFVVSEQTDLVKQYDISVVVHIETSKRIDCTFEGVSITYSPFNTALWQYTFLTTSYPDTTLDIEGNSHLSYAATKTGASSINVPTSVLTSANNIVQSIEGFVIVPKEK